eukprot:gene16006-biopygen705
MTRTRSGDRDISRSDDITWERTCEACQDGDDCHLSRSCEIRLLCVECRAVQWSAVWTVCGSGGTENNDGPGSDGSNISISCEIRRSSTI